MVLDNQLFWNAYDRTIRFAYAVMERSREDLLVIGGG
jgi:hypothetical protein